MIKEAIEKILDLAIEPVVQPDPEPKHVYLLRKPDGTYDRREADPRPRGYEFFTLDDLVRAIQEFNENKAAKVFAGRGQVICVLDEKTSRRSRLTMGLPQSHEFKRLTLLEEQRQPRNQKQFLDLLRIDLAGAVDTDVVAFFRSLSFKKSDEGDAKVGQSGQSLGRKIETQVRAAGQDIPETIAMKVCVYRDLAEAEHRQTITCAVSVDFEALTFTLIPVNGELERIQRETDAWLVGELAERLTQDVPVFCGR